MKCAHTFASKHVRWAGFLEVHGLAATGPLPQEVPQNDSQEGDTGNATNHATNDWADRSRTCCRDGQSRWRRGGRGCAARGPNSGTRATCIGSDEEIVEDVWIGRVGTSHCDVNLVSTVREFWCLEVDDRSGVVNPWFLGTNYNVKLGQWLMWAPFPSSYSPGESSIR